MKTSVIATAATAFIASTASADFVGWTSTVRAVSGGYLVNVFAATNNSSDAILNVYGGTPGQPSEGRITTNSAGGFLQGAGALSVWAPSGSQNWTTLDSFLTIGGSFNTNSNAWTASSATAGDPPWNVSYTDSDTGEETTVNAFNTQSNWSGFTNPYSNTIPAAGGFFVAGTSSPARSLNSLGSIRSASSNAAAAAASFGMLVGQFYVAQNTVTEMVKFTNMGASLRRSDSTFSQAAFSLTVTVGSPPQDSDNDGVPNSSDPCPTVAGPCGGCPVNACGSCGTAPDSDQDGVPNCQDNCPSIANPSQADCNGNGIGDPCDIASGFSLDINTNGIPDSCEADCNDNDLPDAWEISTGLTTDCNTNGLPDTCEGAITVARATNNLGAPSGDEVRAFTFTELEPAVGPVRITVDLSGDLNGVTEFADVIVGSQSPRRFFVADGQSCPQVPDRAVIQLTAAEFNALTDGSDELSVTVACPVTVDPTECKGSGLTIIKLDYVGVGPDGDCNGNRALDACDIASGAAQDCNGNGRPDSCDLAAGTAADCNGNGIPDTCDIASGVDPDCNANSIPDTCDIASGTSVDIDDNAKPDECQTVTVPGSFATIQAAIDAAPANEMRIVKLSAGSYPGPVAFNGKPIILRGVGAAQTIIEGNAGQQVSVVRFTGGEPGIAAIERLTVRGGTSGTVLPGTSFFLGGGVFGQDSSAKIRQCVIENNSSAFGGGVYLLRCTTVVSNTTIRTNSANSDGGGLQASQGAVNVIDTVIEDNFCNARGGGMHLVQGAPILNRVTVRNNVSNNLIGGVSWYSIGATDSLLRMEACTVTGNSALVTQGGIGVSETTSEPPTLSLVGTNACGNLPRPNVAGRWIDLGGNVVCDCPGDFNADGLVNGLDLGVMLSQWGVCSGANCVCDLDGDGSVNGADLGLLLGDWGGCG
jgi:hypothetical protein